MNDYNEIDLSGSWGRLWGNITSGDEFNQLWEMATMVGIALLAGAVIMAIWKKRRGGGGGNNAMVWVTVIVGSILVAPNLVFPMVLTILDLVVNTFIRVFN